MTDEENKNEYETALNNALKMLGTAKSFVVATGDGMVGFASVGMPAKDDAMSLYACAVSLATAIKRQPPSLQRLILNVVNDADTDASAETAPTIQ